MGNKLITDTDRGVNNKSNGSNASGDTNNKENKLLDNSNKTIDLHWDYTIPRRGLGDLLTVANHIAITVSDVGRALWFYSDIIGFQQIRRPNFDRHGAWLTMGNIELHLILGKPMVHSGDDLIVSHISIETNNIQEVLKRLKEMEIPFETNVSVPKGNETEGIVTQFFLRDPDGYYIEICNCGILTDFCIGKDKTYIDGYMEGVKSTVDLSMMAKFIQKAAQAKKREANEDHEKILNEYDKVDGSHVEVDEEKLSNLLKRTHVYGDIVQGETEESLKEILKKTNNDVPKAISYIEAKHGGNQMFQPPTIYRNNEEAHKPPTFAIEK